MQKQSSCLEKLCLFAMVLVDFQFFQLTMDTSEGTVQCLIFSSEHLFS